ncbi:hypothetical protein GDO81_011503 [Engystomops pustulosus]|uniref:Uncharacterized protein n=1 Tax=Engystomops pustulosus TaxID=76066 RepID=A0AAV7BEI6_ENGPU|nr:hypothetical protein GDO81_011503 [Engystomops pustulosus]
MRCMENLQPKFLLTIPSAWLLTCGLCFLSFLIRVLSSRVTLGLTVFPFFVVNSRDYLVLYFYISDYLLVSTKNANFLFLYSPVLVSIY